MYYEKGEKITDISSLTFGTIVYNEAMEYAVFTHEGLIKPIDYKIERKHRHILPASHKIGMRSETWYSSGVNLGDVLMMLSEAHELHSV